MRIHIKHTIEIENRATSELLLDLTAVELELSRSLVVTEDSGTRLARVCGLEVGVEVRLFLSKKKTQQLGAARRVLIAYVSTNPEVSCEERRTRRTSGSSARRDGLSRRASG